MTPEPDSPLTALAGVGPTWGQSDGVGIRYVHNLSSFSGPVETDYVAMFADLVHDELFISQGDRIRVFNANGMEVYQFVYDVERGPIGDFVVNSGGDL